MERIFQKIADCTELEFVTICQAIKEKADRENWQLPMSTKSADSLNDFEKSITDLSHELERFKREHKKFRTIINLSLKMK